METTWAEKMMARGEANGIRATLRRFLERRFGPLSERTGQRLDAIDEAEVLRTMSDRAFDGASLDELGLA